MNGLSSSAEAVISSIAVPDVKTERAFWPGFLLGLASTSIVIGLLWDISWHISIGRDTFWTPAHMAIYVGGALAGAVGGWLVLRHTFLLRTGEQQTGVSVFGLRAPLGAWVAIWGALAMLTSAPFDDWWHNAYGLDVKIISPPHAVLGLGMFGISVGAVLLALSQQNRSEQEVGGWLFVYAGGIFLTMGAIFVTEYTFPNAQHGGLFYKVCAITFPFRLVAFGRAGRISWPATRVAAVYLAIMCLTIWILPLFPAQPKLAPIYNQLTHMVPPAFPLLLIFPALAVDLVLRRVGENIHWWQKIMVATLMGGAFLAVFLGAQWFFAKFMLSPAAENWFFAGNRYFGYGSDTGAWRSHFWDQDRSRPDADLLTPGTILVSWIIASLGAWIGLVWGNWMRKVKR